MLAERGASFWNQLRAAAPGAADAELLAALWDLVWAGEVTNDSLAPLRAVLGGGVGAGRAAPRGGARPAAAARAGSTASGRRPAPGRWSLVAPLLEPAPTPTEAAHAAALQLVERHGVVTREAVLAEGVVGGYASVYGVLKVLEERGQVRRGYFVDGLGAAQFALPGAVDRLRMARERADDDRQRRSDHAAARARRHRPGPALRRRARLAGVAGPAGAHRRRASSCCATACRSPGTTAAPTTSSRSRTPATTARGPRRSPTSCATAALRRVEVRKVDGEPLAIVAGQRRGHRGRQVAAGFTDGYRGLQFTGR